MAQGHVFHNEPSLLIVEHRASATRAQKVVCCVASICRYCEGVIHDGTHSCRPGIFHCIQFLRGNAALFFLNKLT